MDFGVFFGGVAEKSRSPRGSDPKIYYIYHAFLGKKNKINAAQMQDLIASGTGI